MITNNAEEDILSSEDLQEIEDIEKEYEKHNTDTDYVPLYLKNKLSHKLLSKEESYKYIKLAQAGDTAARDYLVDHNIKLVYSSALHYAQGRDDMFMDLFQEGCLGMMKAINDFDISKDVAFSTYAMNWILNYMQRFLMNFERGVRVPIHVREKYMKIRRVIAQYEKEYGTTPTTRYIAEQLELPEEKIQFIITSNDFLISLNKPIGVEYGSDAESEFGDFIEDKSESVESQVEKKILTEDIDVCIKKYLTEKEEKVIRMRFGLSPYYEIMTLDDIGKEFGVTRERIRQIESKAILKMKKQAKKELRAYREV